MLTEVTEMQKIKAFFEPRSVAVVGASANPQKIGFRVLGNILLGEIPEGDNVTELIMEQLASGKRGFRGKIYPVNKKGGEILGLKVYKSISEIPEPIDHAIICVPPQFVKGVITELGQHKCYAATVITAGFGEIGRKDLEQELVEEARKWGVRIIGPNCFGIFNTHIRFNATFGQRIPLAGPISFVSQSGAVGASAIIYGLAEGIGFRYFVSIGNKADVSDADLIRYYASDPKTKCIGLYIESFHNGREFFEAAKEVSWRVPIVALKSGRTQAGQKAASSHTGAIASSDVAVDAAFKQAGVFRAITFYGFMDAARALGYQFPPKGENIVILTNAGGAGVITADYMNDLGLKLAELKPETIEKINEVCPPTWSHGNPVDIVGDAGLERFVNTYKILLKAEEVDAFIILITPVGHLDTLALAKKIVELSADCAKPVLASLVGVVQNPADDYLEEHGIPTYSFPERAAYGMYALVSRSRYLRRVGVL